MDDKRAALLLATLALAGAATRLWLAPRAAAPGDVHLSAPAPPVGGLQATARQAVRLTRPLAPGERIDVDAADVTELTRLPHVGPSLAQRLVTWRGEHGPFGSLARLDSVPGIGPKLLDALRPFVSFSGAVP